jgi:CheY-like chemotaxis protein
LIVIIDDHVDTGLAMTKLLGRCGIPSRHFDSAAAALAVIEALRPSLLVLDQIMPGLWGTDVLRAIRSIPALAEIPAIFYSASFEGEDEARALGAKVWLSKGKTTWEQLIDAVQAAYRVSHRVQ